MSRHSELVSESPWIMAAYAARDAGILKQVQDSMTALLSQYLLPK